MPSRRERLAEGLRHDPKARRKSQRFGKQKGATIYISGAELRAHGIDPDGPPPEYLIYPADPGRPGGLRLRLYK